jgi:charged multivesicular body protein 1
MDLEKIAAVMEQFEKSFDSLDLASATVDGAMGSATAASMPEEEVDALINQVADAYSLEVKSRVADASRKPIAQQQVEESQEDELEKRLAALRAVEQ